MVKYKEKIRDTHYFCLHYEQGLVSHETSRVQGPTSTIRVCIINGDLRGLMGGRSGRVATQLSVSSSSIPTSSLSGSLRVLLKNRSVDFLLGFHEPVRRKSSVFVFLCRTLLANFCISMTHRQNTSERKTGSFILAING